MDKGAHSIGLNWGNKSIIPQADAGEEDKYFYSDGCVPFWPPFGAVFVLAAMLALVKACGSSPLALPVTAATALTCHTRLPCDAVPRSGCTPARAGRK